MPTGAELATAWVRLVPSMEGVQGTVAKALDPAAEEGEKAGDKTGKGFSAKARLALAAGGAVMVAGVVAAFKGLYEVGSTFDEITDTIRVGTGAQGTALDGLVNVAKNVGKSVPAEFNKIGPVVSDLNTRLGLSGKTLETVSSQYLEAGRILGQDVDIKSTTAAFNAFKIEGKDVTTAMDTLFQVSQATGVGMNELAAGIQTNAPALQNLGFSFQDSVALMGSLDKAGMNSTAIMASMGKGMVMLAKDGEKPEEAFKRTTKEVQGFIDKGDTAAALDLAGKVFGTKGASQFVGALQSGALNMTDLMKATGATGDTILGVGAETMDFAERWQILMNKAMLAIEPLANAVFTALGDGLSNAMPFLDAFGKWVADNQVVIPAFAVVIGVLLLGAIISLTAAFFGWAAGVWAVTVAFLANPITWIVLGIIALITAIVLLIANWQAVASFLTDVWNAVVTWFLDTLADLGKRWNEMWTNISDFFKTVWNAVKDWFVGLWNGLVSWYIGLLVSFALFILDKVNYIASFWRAVWQGIVDWFTGLWNGVTGFVRGVMQGISDAVSGAMSWLSDAWNNSWQGMVDFLSNVFGTIVKVVKVPLNAVISLINGAISGINAIHIDIPDWIPGIGGQKWGLHIPKIPMLAKGGTLTAGGYTVVGENGPELLKLPKGAQVNPNYDDLPDDKGVTFNNYAPLGQTPAQALTEFSNRAKGL